MERGDHPLGVGHGAGGDGREARLRAVVHRGARHGAVQGGGGRRLAPFASTREALWWGGVVLRAGRPVLGRRQRLQRGGVLLTGGVRGRDRAVAHLRFRRVRAGDFAVLAVCKLHKRLWQVHVRLLSGVQGAGDRGRGQRDAVRGMPCGVVRGGGGADGVPVMPCAHHGAPRIHLFDKLLLRTWDLWRDRRVSERVQRVPRSFLLPRGPHGLPVRRGGVEPLQQPGGGLVRVHAWLLWPKRGRVHRLPLGALVRGGVAGPGALPSQHVRGPRVVGVQCVRCQLE
mmetsp:Transcript_10182/g.24685  ORF Transcript_10182/g.24685 Transcript_10182/m.24685 type:complete len:284 (+) Transcript_10182:2484-3335(+)